jgi:hypothetical protein
MRAGAHTAADLAAMVVDRVTICAAPKREFGAGLGHVGRSRRDPRSGVKQTRKAFMIYFGGRIPTP